MGASAAAAIVLLKEKQIVAAFRQGGATSAPAAATPAALGVHQRLALGKLRERAVLREAAHGYFYLDEPSWVALRRARRRVAIVVGLMVLVALLAFLARRAASGAV